MNRIRVLMSDTVLRVRPALLSHLVKHLLGVKRREIRAHSGLSFWVDPFSDLGNALLRNGEYEPDLALVLSQLLRPNDTFLDIGANEGYFSVLAGHLAKRGRVIAFEPQSDLRSVLERNFSLNQLPNVELHSTALGRANGNRDLYLAADTNSGASSFRPLWRLAYRKESVQVRTLDSVLEGAGTRSIRLAKVDCEGAEVDVIAGAKESLGRHCIEIVAMEYHAAIVGADECFETHKRIASAGYCLGALNGKWVYYLPEILPELSLLPTFEPRVEFREPPRKAA